MVSAWRIVKRRHAGSAFSGEGARLFGGRWNYPGTAIVYMAESRALAALEMLVHLDGAELLSSYLTIRADFDEEFVEAITMEQLPTNWRREPALETIRGLGEEWAAAGRSPILRVPSVVIPAECNFLLNPRHPHFSRISIGPPIAFEFDKRLTRQS
jgi:RES domain-containing protein